MLLYLDLETCPIDGADQFVEAPDAPSNYGPEATAKFQAKAKATAIDRAALDLDLARICCLGMECDGVSLTRCFPDEASERIGLEMLFDTTNGFGEKRLVTFNGFKFDLPLILRRAAYLGLPIPKINLDKYRSPHLDLWNVLSHNGSVPAHSLSWYVKRLGWADLQGTLPGRDIPQAVRDGRWEEIQAHCKADVLATKRLAEWLGLAKEPQ
jgi:hypothetical protein